MRLLAIGDFHIPARAKEVPAWVTSKVQSLHPDRVLCTGDLEDERIVDWLQTLSKEVVCVAGNMDWADLPEEAVVEAEGFKVGVVHGSNIVPRGDPAKLAQLAKAMGARVLVNGHTHSMRVEEHDGILLVNPGSATGAWGGSSDEGEATFILIETARGKARVTRFTPNGEEASDHGL